MEELRDIAFDYIVTEELNSEIKFTKINLKMSKLMAINLHRGDIVELIDGELLCVTHKKYIAHDSNGFQVCEIYLEGA